MVDEDKDATQNIRTSKVPESSEEAQTETKKPKTLNNSDIKGARKQVPDIKIFGNGDLFKLLCKASSKEEGWMKSTKAMEIPNVGCLVQVSTQQGDQVAEALEFVPGVKIGTDTDGTRRLVKAE